MSTLADQLDRFVRWFFNSSPNTDLIQPAEPRLPGRGAAGEIPAKARVRATDAVDTHHPRARMNRINA